MEHDYFTERLNLHVASPQEANSVLDFHLSNKTYFEPYEEKKPLNFYTENFQYRNLATESISFINGSFIRYYLFPIKHVSRIIGTISFKLKSDNDIPIILVGYKIAHNEWHNGFAYEALSFIIPRICLNYNKCIIQALVQPNNISSINLLKKIGMNHKEGDDIVCNINGFSINHHIYNL